MKHPRFSPFQILVHLGAWVPLGLLVINFFNNQLTANPIQAAEIRMGDTAITLLILSLACTPLNMLFHLPVLIKVRRPLGLYAYLYASIHLMIFLGLDYGFDTKLILQTITEKPFILAGLLSFLILSALAITSIRYWMVRLGKKWKYLHRLVYMVNLTVVLHFAWSGKGDFLRLQGDIQRPLLACVLVLLLLILRLPVLRKILAGRLSSFVPIIKKIQLPQKVHTSE